MSNGGSEVQPFSIREEMPTPSAGALLHEARLAAGVHIESIAFSLKVPVSKIEALERDDLEALPDAVFARALTSSVCRTLKMDPGPVLALLPQSTTQFLPASSAGVNAAFRDGSERSRARSALARMSRPLAVAVILLVVGAGVLAWVPASWLQLEVARSPESQPASTINTSPVLVDAGKADTSLEGGAATLAPTPDSPVEPASSTTTAMSADSPLEGDHPVATSTPRLMMTARGETWVQVKDAQGAILLERILRLGETASVNQPGRLSVVVGRADATEVLVAGEKRDITAVARENVARFEVKP